MTRAERPAPRRIGGVVDAATGRLGKVLGATSFLPRRRGHGVRRGDWRPGTPAGIESVAERHTPPPLGSVRLRCTDYGPKEVRSFEIEDLEAFLSTPGPDLSVRWIDVEGLHPYIVDRLRRAYGLHTLAAEDVLHVPQRPKAGEFDGQLFVVTGVMSLAGEALAIEQVSFFLLPSLLISFQEAPPDAWVPIRARLNNPNSRLRRRGADFLLYTLLDAAVDHGFPLLEALGDRLEALESDMLASPGPEHLAAVHRTKRDLLALRRVMWPTRQLLDTLRRDEDALLSEATRTFLYDVQDHCVQIIDIVETYREIATGLTDLYMSALSNRMNEIMKVLTIIATMFIPITFLAGVYGMNFEHMPEMGARYAYPLFWAVCLVVLAALTFYFWWRGWLGKP